MEVIASPAVLIMWKPSKSPRSTLTKRSGDLLVGVVAPRSGIGSGAGENADGRVIADMAPVIAAIDGAQAGRPGKKQAADADGIRRVGAVIGKSDVIGAVYQVGKRLIAGASGIELVLVL